MKQTETILRFPNETQARTAIADIDRLMGYPNGQATTYAQLEKTKGNRWAIALDSRRVTDVLVAAYGVGLENHPQWLEVETEMNERLNITRARTKAERDADNQRGVP